MRKSFGALVVVLLVGCGNGVTNVEQAAKDKIACEQSGGTVEIRTYGVDNYVSCRYK